MGRCVRTRRRLGYGLGEMGSCCGLQSLRYVRRCLRDGRSKRIIGYVRPRIATVASYALQLDIARKGCLWLCGCVCPPPIYMLMVHRCMCRHVVDCARVNNPGQWILLRSEKWHRAMGTSFHRGVYGPRRAHATRHRVDECLPKVEER